MGTTPNYALRYPEGADPPNVAPYIKNLADDTDAQLAALSSTYAYAPGRWYAAPELVRGTTGQPQSDGVASAAAFHAQGSLTLDRLAIEVMSAGSTGAVVRLGIYADDAGLPGDLVLDGGTVDATTTGLKELTISQALTSRRRYWFVTAPQGNPATQPHLRASTSQGVYPAPGSEDSITAVRQESNGWYKTGISGALPGVFGAPTGDAAATTIIGMRAA